MVSKGSTQQYLAAIVEGSDDAIVTKNLDSIIESWNRGAERLFGYTAEEAIGQPITMIFPEDRKDEERDFIARLRRGERIDHYETVRQRKDGTLVAVSLTVSPVRDDQGRIVAASKIARDITLQKNAEEQQRMMLAEMRHRVGNCFSVASGLLSVCARQTSSVDELVQVMRERFQALAAAHTLAAMEPVAAPHLAGVGLRSLVVSSLTPFSAEANELVDIDDLPVASAAITPLALVVYELCTNAAKYGGLSCEEGTLQIRGVSEGDRLKIFWDERFPWDAQTSAPGGEGFGTRMSRTAIEAYLDGAVKWDFTSEGLSAVLDLSLEKLTGA